MAAKNVAVRFEERVIRCFAKDAKREERGEGQEERQKAREMVSIRVRKHKPLPRRLHCPCPLRVLFANAQVLFVRKWPLREAITLLCHNLLIRKLAHRISAGLRPSETGEFYKPASTTHQDKMRTVSMCWPDDTMARSGASCATSKRARFDLS